MSDLVEEPELPPIAEAPVPVGEGQAIADDAKQQGDPATKLDALQTQDYAGDIENKRMYARWMLILMTGQLIVADTAFLLYAWLGRDWDIQPSVMQFGSPQRWLKSLESCSV